ncbi:MAG: hypothetical protein PHP42_07785 [Bacteroidota bacterium]|nr:hypothetical protein [Bacteroidota bacterium]
MDKIGYIEIRINGSTGNIPLTPDSYDIREIISMLGSAENLLFPNDKRDRPIVSYKIEEGSVKNIFKTSLQYIIGFNAVLGLISQNQNIDFLDAPTAKAFEEFQYTAQKKNYSFTIRTSIENSSQLTIDRTTNFLRNEAIWADAEFYFYGKVTNAGGKDKANIHIVTEELGTVRIETPISFLEQREENLLYKPFGIRATGKQHSETGEIDIYSLKFKELIDYNPKYDEKYLRSLRERAKKTWQGIDTDAWLRNLRGGYDA